MYIHAVFIYCIYLVPIYLHFVYVGVVFWFLHTHTHLCIYVYIHKDVKECFSANLWKILHGNWIAVFLKLSFESLVVLVCISILIFVPSVMGCRQESVVSLSSHALPYAHIYIYMYTYIVLCTHIFIYTIVRVCNLWESARSLAEFRFTHLPSWHAGSVSELLRVNGLFLVESMLQEYCRLLWSVFFLM